MAKALPYLDGVHGLVYLVVQALYLLLAGGGQEEGVHLGLERVVHLHVDVVASRFLLVGAAEVLHRDQVVDDLKGRDESYAWASWAVKGREKVQRRSWVFWSPTPLNPMATEANFQHSNFSSSSLRN